MNRLRSFSRTYLYGSIFAIFGFASHNASAATLYVSTQGSDANGCTQAQPCKTFDRAYQMARSGDVVLVGAGNYPDQPTINRNANVTGTNSQIADGNEVTFKPAGGAVVVDGMHVGTQYGPSVDHIAFEGITFSGYVQVGMSNDVHFTRCNIHAQFLSMLANYLSLRQNDIGSHSMGDGIDLYAYPYFSTNYNKNILIEENYIHHVTTSDPEAHPDTIAVDGATNLTIRKNKFYQNCGINYRGGSNPGVSGTLLIENNFFGEAVACAVGTYYTAQIAGVNAIIRYNTFQGAIQPNTDAERDGQLWEGNIITSGYGYGMCPGGNMTFRYNVWGPNNPPCGTGDKVVSNFGFVNAAAGDFHLTSSSPAINAGNPASFPGVDIDGQARPASGAPDAGADEYSGAAPAPTPTPTPMPSPTPSPTPTPPPTGSQVIRFDDLSSPGRALTGQYPVGVIDWGTSGSTYLSGPWEALTTNSLSYNGSSVTALSFSILASNQTLAQLDIYNGGVSSASITIKCGGMSKSVSVPSKQMMSVQTGFSSACTSVSITCSNGWNTNFDNLVLSTLGAPAPSPTPAPTPTPTPTPAPTVVTVSFNDLANPGRALTGQYPVSVIDWGTSGNAYLSEPWGQFTTNSLSFNGSSIKSLSFVLMKSLTLNQLDIYNGGSGSATITVMCGSTSKSVSVAAGQVLVYKPGFTSPCSSVTLKSTNGWGTNFDNLVLK